MLNPLSKHTLYITGFFPQEPFYLPALISDSFRPLSSSVCDITLLFLFGEGYYTQHRRLSLLLLHTHSCVSALRSKPHPTVTHFTVLTHILTPQPSHALALQNNSWSSSFFIKSNSLTLSILQRRCFSIFSNEICIYLYVLADLQRNWDLPQSYQGDLFWQSRVQHHWIRYGVRHTEKLHQIDSLMGFIESCSDNYWKRVT